MKRKINDLCLRVVYYVAIGILLIITTLAVLYTTDNDGRGLIAQNIILSLLPVPVGLFLVECGYRLVKKMNINIGWLVTAVIIWCESISLIWILISKIKPNSDELAVYSIAMDFAEGNLSSIQETGSYLSLWPFQISIISIYESILRLAPIKIVGMFHYLQIPNLIFLALIILSGWQLCKRLFKSEKTQVCFLLLQAICLPLLMYMPVVYGEVPAIGLMMFAAWMLYDFLEKEGRSERTYQQNVHTPKRSWGSINGVLCFLATVAALLFRQSCAIFVIALMIVIILSVFQKYSFRKVLLGAGIVIFSLLLTPTMKGIYEQRAGNVMGEGVPVEAYIAMGLQGNGCWNGFNSGVMVNNEYDEELAKEISRNSIKESIDEYISDPQKMFEFYKLKLGVQWAREDYGMFFISSRHSDNRAAWVEMLFQGTLHEGIRVFMGTYQLIVYIGILLYSVKRRKSNEVSLVGNLLLITIIGGFFFSILWEGGARYVFPYLVLGLPYAAEGIVSLWQKVLLLLHKEGSKNTI